MSITTYLLKYSSRDGRQYESEMTTSLSGSRLRQSAEREAREEIKDRYPNDDLADMTIEYAGAGDRARRTGP
jgi:hypothetical protein